MSAIVGPPPTPEQLAALAKGQKDGQAVIIWTVGMFCIFGWDYLMNFPKEVRRIWQKKFTYASALYVLNRYYGLIQFAVIIPMIITPITSVISAETCKKIHLWQPVGALISTFLSQTIMGGRVYALYAKSTIVLVTLGFIMLAELLIHIYVLTQVFPAPSPAPGVVVPCVVVGPTNWLVAFWAMPLVFDTITFLLTLKKSAEHWKNQVESSTLAVLFRDGLVYFAAIFSMNLINVVLFVTQIPTLQAINLPATLMLNIIMSCRLILNLRAPRSGVTLHNSDSSRAERKVPLWSTSKPNTSYELSSSSTSPHAGVSIVKATDTFKSYDV